jgi:hypothetical protein
VTGAIRYFRAKEKPHQYYLVSPNYSIAKNSPIPYPIDAAFKEYNKILRKQRSNQTVFDALIGK